MITLRIDDTPVEVPDGVTVLQAARAGGITIPTLCDHPALSPSGNCRLCLIEVEGGHGQLAACTTPARDGMIVRTETPPLVETRRLVLEMLLRGYVDTGGAADGPDASELSRWTHRYGEMIPGIQEGRTHALYILGENPAMTDPDSAHVRQCLDACDFILLQEIFPSETSQFADVLLPGTSFAEKTGTFTNTERRVQMCRRAVAPRGQAREDWRVIADLATRVLQGGGRAPRGGTHAGWGYASTSDVMAEINALTPIYAGVTHARLERGDRLQWPVPGVDQPGTPILHTTRFTRGRGRFTAVEHVPPAEMPDAAYPMLLNTGRVLYHWHGGEMTRRAEGLMAVYGETLIEVSPEDARRIGLDGARRVRVTSRRGAIEARAWVTDRVPAGTVYANFHFPEASANELTIAALDPVAKIPEYKVCAVRLEVAR